MTVEHLDKIAWPVRVKANGLAVEDCDGNRVAFSDTHMGEKTSGFREASELLATLLNAGHAALTGGESDGWRPIESAPKDGTWVQVDNPRWVTSATAQFDSEDGVWRCFSEDRDITDSGINPPLAWKPAPARYTPPEPEPEPDPWALLREMLVQYENVRRAEGYPEGDSASMAAAREALAAHDAREGGE